MYARNAAKIAFPKNPEMKIFVLNVFSKLALIPPKTESKEANIATEI